MLLAMLEPWQTPEGRARIEQWIAVSMARLNSYQGNAEFNSRKPWSMNKYGLVEGHGLTSSGAPVNFGDYNYDRYHYMWDHYIPAGANATWIWPEWNAAKIEPLRDFVLKP